MLQRQLAVAPMLDWTDRHCRYFLRLITRHALLYTEMVTTGAILHGEKHRFLAFNQDEHPLALQLGGSEPRELAECARIATDYGYDEVNLNVGCPSNRVQSGRFGACLMAEPLRVADCVAAMRAVTPLPVTVKCRIGIDDHDSYEALHHFVSTVAAAGCHVFIVHARKAWLSGLSPKENREIPPLCYPTVYQLKRDFPALCVIINGGITELAAAQEHLRHVDGVMLGRSAYQSPYILAEVDQLFYSAEQTSLTRLAIVEKLLPYIEQHVSSGGALHHITRHILGLFQGLPGARSWRRHLSQHAHRPGASASVVQEALAYTSM